MTRTATETQPALADWTIDAAREFYRVRQWGGGYFDVNELGHVTVSPEGDPARAIDLKALVDQLSIRGIEPPVLIRFTGILRHRIRRVAEAFARATAEYGYEGKYACVYPIKVNQQRHVAEEVRDFGAEHGFGLEAGSKPELLAVLAMIADKEGPARDVPVVCNGFKDAEFIETVILAQKIGKRVIPIVEKYSELKLIIEQAERHNVMPMLGVRVKLSARGAGRWEGSGGVRSKFGLFVSEVVEALGELKKRGMESCLKLVHCHLGSQISNIRNVKEGIEELARVYTSLRQMGAGLEYIDIGGGLGVDYDGSSSDSDSSINYSLEEYASDVVWRIKTVCDETETPHPTILSESGRALVAHHSLMVMNVLGVAGLNAFNAPSALPAAPEGAETPQPLLDLFDAYREAKPRRYAEAYHDAVTAYEQSMNLFKLGYMSLEHRALAERLFWATCGKIVQFARNGKGKRLPAELQDLPGLLRDTYFINVSVFQSLPDSWAIDQRFPIVPIHRLGEKPNRRAILADITCDSDGCIDHFVVNDEEDRSLALHEYRDEPYLLGAFLVGAYQETLGDLHNLFGDTHAVHVELDADGEVVINHVVRGDTVREVLSYVEFSPDQMLADVRREVERAVRAGKLTLAESAQFMRFYEDGLNGYTYLE